MDANALAAALTHLVGRTLTKADRNRSGDGRVAHLHHFASALDVIARSLLASAQSEQFISASSDKPAFELQGTKRGFP